MKSNVGEQEKVTLAEAAKLMKFSYKYAMETYLSWKDKYGITAFRLGRKLLFKRSEIERAFEASALN